MKNNSKIRCPLIKRIPRELWKEKGKYAVIFIFMILMIGLISGFLIAGTSLKKAYDDGFEKYNTEDGNFTLTNKADEKLLSEIEKNDVKVYEKLYKDEPYETDKTLRIFTDRTDVNKASLLDGNMPNSDNEIAADRIFCKKNDIKLGGSIKIDGKDFKVTGIIALPEYAALFKNNTDFMFDAINFGVAAVTDKGFESIGNKHLKYCYAFKYNESPSDVFGKDAQDKSEVFMENLSKTCAESGNALTGYTPTCSSNAVKFAGDDIGGDRIMFIVMLYIMMIIIAFIFAITTSNTISTEANVIGTLRATGYSKWELIRHYMTPSVIVLIISAVIGNLLGYTVFYNIFLDTYLGSYSLPKYYVVFSADAFVQTTVGPTILMLLITFIMLVRKLSLSPLKFIRRDLKRKQRKKAFKLNTKIPIKTRFKLRVIFQNIPNYLTIFVGIFFGGVIMFFGSLFSPLLDDLEQQTIDNMISKHQYILKAPAETKTKGAEKYCAGSLQINQTKDFSESVSIYGTEENSQYVHADLSEGNISVSSALADKYGFKKGDTLKLKEEYGDKKYELKINGIYDYPCTLAVFMSRDKFNETFDLDTDNFNGYFSNEEITDIDDAFIAADITEKDLTTTSRQLKDSMGNMMNLFTFAGVAVYILVIYLLAKIIIEKNTQSISMTKILGYNNREINSLYLHTTSAVALISLIITLPLIDITIKVVWQQMMLSYTGWLPYQTPVSAIIKTFVLGLASYIIVALLLSRKAKKVPMAEALKNVE